MIKNLFRAAIIIIISVLSATFFQFIDINNVSPNVIIITIVSISILQGRNEGLVFAVFFGLIQDIFYGPVVGYHVLIYVAIAYVTSMLYRNFYGESMVIPLIAIGASDVAYNVIVFITTFMFRGSLKVFYYLYAIILPEVTYTVVVAVLLYRIYIVYSHFMHDYEKEHRKGDDDFYEKRF